MKEFIEIPFGAKDSELGGWEYNIPEGYTASIENGKIMVKKEESEDEKIRKTIYNCVKWIGFDSCLFKSVSQEKCLAWLEKQGEKKPINDTDEEIVEAVKDTSVLDMVESKFKAEDWIVDVNDGEILHINKVLECVYEVTNLKGGVYQSSRCSIETWNRLWTIQDAKDGDVLVDNCGNICIYQEPSTKLMYHSYCYGNNKHFIDGEGSHAIVGTYPATKEQCDLLFQKMKEEGYEWDAKKKELKKIHVIDEDKAEMDYCFTKMMNGEKVSSVWSEEDIKALNRISTILVDASEVKSWWKEYRLIEREEMIRLTNFLKSLIDRIHPQPTEWSEEDEEMFDAIIADIQFTQKAHNNEINQIVFEREIEWLKSLKERFNLQPQWTPSEEQIQALDEVYKTHGANGTCRRVIFNLLEQLKKL